MSPSFTTRRVNPYLASAGMLAASVLARWLLDPILGDELPFVTLFAAVAGAAWIGGWKPAVAAAVVGYLAVSYLFIAPRGDIVIAAPALAVGAAAYLFTCGIIVAFGETARRAHAVARDRQETLEVTFRSIGDAVITTDLQGRVTYLNPVAESMTGWPLAEATGQRLDAIFRIVNEATREPVPSPAERALREGVIVGLANHTVLLRRDGAELPIDDSAAPIRDEDGQVSGAVLIFRDISERRALERKAQDRYAAASQLAAIVHDSDDAVIRKSLDGRIQSWNGGAERIFGYTAEEAIGRHISLIIPPDRLAEEDAIIATLKAGGRVEHFETERVRRDRTRITISLAVSPIRDEAGNVVGASKIARDVTRQRQGEQDRHRLEGDLRKLAADLSEADRRKDEFLATLAHELRNPLAPLSNALEILKRSEGNAEMVHRVHATMDRQLSQLVRLVDDLLDLNRITHGRLELRRSHLELGPVIQQAVEASRPLAEAARHALHVTIAPEPIWLDGDPARLAQVVGNLINNACRYTRPGGQIWVSAAQRNGKAEIRVRDTGIGIAADKQGTIFEMFTQVHRSLEQSQGGLGIGLTLVRQLVTMHGGKVEVSSEGENRGSEFVVRLPTLTSMPAPPRQQPPETNQVAQSGRILVVDDNRDSAASLAMLLELTGHQTWTAHDGPAAFEAAKEHRPDVVLLDIGLPKMSGYDVCRMIRETSWGRDMLLFAVTGWGQQEDRRKSQDAGFDGHLVKPVEYEALMTLLRELGQRHHSR